MKAYYLVALFAIVAVANAGSDYATKDSKTQDQYADGTQSEISDNGGGLVVSIIIIIIIIIIITFFFINHNCCWFFNILYGFRLFI